MGIEGHCRGISGGGGGEDGGDEGQMEVVMGEGQEGALNESRRFLVLTQADDPR